VISNCRVSVNTVFRLLERTAVLTGSYRRFGTAYQVMNELMGPDELRSFNRYFVPLGTEIQFMAVLSLHEDPP